MKLRLGFGARILLALVGTVLFLTGTSLWVVGHQTRSQVQEVVDRTAQRAGEVLSEVEDLRFELFEPVVAQFAFAPRALSLLARSLDEDDFLEFAGELHYELELRAVERGLLVVTDMRGQPVVTYLDRELVHEPGDPGPGIGTPDPLVRAILDEDQGFATGYRLFEGRPYSAHAYFLDFFGRPLGTLTLGLPMDDELARRLGDVVGAEVCFVVEGRCVAGTPDPGDEMRDRLAAGAASVPDPGTGRRARGDTPTEVRGAPVDAAGDPVTTRWNGSRWALVVAPLPGGEEAGIMQVLGVPLDPVLAPFDRIRAVQRWAGLGALTLAVLLGLLLSRGLVRPVRTLVEATDRVRSGDYEFRVDVPSGDEMGYLAGAFNQMLGDLALKERYRGILDKVVSRDIAEEMLRGEIRLGGETREVTALFADVRGFTSLSEGLGSQQVITLLNEWFDRAAGVVEAEGGVVDKFLGDGVMAIFGAPMSQDDHPVRAVRAALGMRQRVEELNVEREARSRPPVLVGIGVASGPVVAGNMGSQNRLNYTVLGEAVNLAARLCGEAGPGEVLVSPATREAVENAGFHLEGEEEEARQVKGVSRPVKPWRIERLEEGESRSVPSGPPE